jgi:flagellar motor switch protein FliN/FliY
MNSEKQAQESSGCMFLDTLEIDTIGEILNISMGAAATTVSTLLNRKVSITTPTVRCIKTDEFEIEELEPADGVEIEYIKGLHGSNLLVMKRKDVRTIVDLLLGESISESEEELTEMQVSALSEIMNQMMGSSSTALADFFGKSISISIPRRFDVENVKEKISEAGFDGIIVTVSFLFKVEGLIDSTFCTILPLDFTRELVKFAMEMSANGSPPETAPAKAGTAPEPEGAAAGAAAREEKPGAAPAGEETAGDREPGEDSKEENILTKPGYDRRALQKVNVQPLKLVSFDEDGSGGGVIEDTGNLDLIMDVPLEITVEIGRAKKLIKEILELEQGSILEISKQAGDSVDVVVNGRLMARGDVVVVDDNFGVRLTEIVSIKEIFRYL